MGYRNMIGLVGKYRGDEVFVIEYENLKRPVPGDHSIYAVRHENNDKLELVQDGKFIGTMTDKGYIDLCDASRRRDYIFYTKEQRPSKPAPEREVKKTPEQKLAAQLQEEPLIQGLDVSMGYGEFSRIVDDFFRGLGKLWDELEVEV